MYYFYNGYSIRKKTPVKALKAASDVEAIVYAEGNLKELLGGSEILYLYNKDKVVYCCTLDCGSYKETYSSGNTDVLAAAQVFADVVQNSYVLPTCPFGSRLRSICLYEEGEDTLLADIVVLQSSKRIDKTIDFARITMDSVTVDKAYLNLLKSLILATPWDIKSITIPGVSFEDTNVGVIARVGPLVRFIRNLEDEGWEVRI